MRNNKLNKQNQMEDVQGKLNYTGNSVPNDNLNQNHNTKKVALGPNTKR